MTKRILLVDDSVLDLALTMQALNSCLTNHILECAVDANEAYRLLSVQQFDILILDLKMPGIDGFEVLRWIQHDAPYRLPVIVMSTSTLERDQYLASKFGAVDYVVKTIDYTEFRESLQAAMSKHGYC